MIRGWGWRISDRGLLGVFWGGGSENQGDIFIGSRGRFPMCECFPGSQAAFFFFFFWEIYKEGDAFQACNVIPIIYKKTNNSSWGLSQPTNFDSKCWSILDIYIYNEK